MKSTYSKEEVVALSNSYNKMMTVLKKTVEEELPRIKLGDDDIKEQVNDLFSSTPLTLQDAFKKYGKNITVNEDGSMTIEYDPETLIDSMDFAVTLITNVAKIIIRCVQPFIDISESATSLMEKAIAKAMLEDVAKHEAEKEDSQLN